MIRALLLLSLCTLPLGAFSLKAGDRFPDIAFPLIGGEEDVSLWSLSEDKLMLHLFASW